LVQIGNSRGVRIPKAFLEQAGLRDEIEIEVHGAQVVIRPVSHPSQGQPCPTRVACRFQGKRGQIVMDQTRAIDRVRLVKRLGKLNSGQAADALAVLGAMFAE